MQRPLFLIATCVSILFSSTANADGFVDEFEKSKRKGRTAARGEWQFKDGMATCKADPELYKKFKNHGPILRWPASFKNGTIDFQMRPKECQRVVLTLNEKGHVFRIALSNPKATRIFGWIGKSSKENKPKTIAKDGVPSIKELDGEWVPIKLAFQDDKLKVKIGQYEATLTHESIARQKGEFTISFASGELDIKPVTLKIES